MKNFIMNNKFVIVITVILLLCLATIGYVVATYFFGGSDTVYGDRLSDINSYILSDSDIEDIVLTIKSNENVLDADVRVNGKIIYVSTGFLDSVSLSNGKKNAVSFLEYFDKSALGYYDINYTIYSEEYTLMGYKNSTSTSIIWNNNTSFEVESE